jgi:hypothetical protein
MPKMALRTDSFAPEGRLVEEADGAGGDQDDADDERRRAEPGGERARVGDRESLAASAAARPTSSRTR